MLQVADWQFIIAVSKQNKELTKKPLKVKLPKRLFITRKSSIPFLRFEKQDLSSYSGLVVFQKLFSELNLSARLSKCSPNTEVNGHTSYSLLFRLLIVHVLIGMRKLRSGRFIPGRSDGQAGARSTGTAQCCDNEPLTGSL